jgi:SAM-dependent methyltransferase
MHYRDIDWNELWLIEQQKKSYRRKKKKDWNKRAASFAKRTADSDFSDLFIKMMAIDPSWSVLDIGCGPGTLALPLAEQGLQVTALDSSEGMLEQLQMLQSKTTEPLVIPVLASWTDSWQELGIKPHDVAIAARSLAVTNLRAGLEKLNRYATQKVFVADRVGAGPFDPDLFKAIGRDFQPGPDFIFTVNILFQMGITPRVDYLEFDQRRQFATVADAHEAVVWMVDDLTDVEQKKIKAYVTERLSENNDGTVTFTRRMPVKWAFISWDVV